MQIEAFISVISRTKDPTAPIKLQEAYSRVEAVGRMMTGLSNKQKALDYQQDLLVAFPKDMDNVAASPEYICALCALLAESLKFFVADSKKD